MASKRETRSLHSSCRRCLAGGRYEQAIEWADRALGYNPGKSTTADAHLASAASHAQLGRIDEVRAALEKALALWPDLTLDLVPLPPYMDPDLRKHYVDGLRLAGLER